MMLDILGKDIAYMVMRDSAEVAHAAAERILLAAEQAIAARGQFHIVLAGGSTPQAAYRLLALADSAWHQWHIYFGDERCLPPDDHDRNSRMAFEAFLDHVAIPREQIHTINAEQGAQRAALEYSTIIGAAMPFDMVLLGMGEDGHTASLFPGQHHDPHAWVVPVHNAPKPPPDRVSLSASALSNTLALLLMVTGAAKQEALRQWANGEALPVALLQPKTPIALLLDRAATGL